jgi:hypothetical protein
MTKHLIDPTRVTPNTCLMRFAQIDRNATPHSSTKALITRKRTQPDHRLDAYTRIARGERA